MAQNPYNQYYDFTANKWQLIPSDSSNTEVVTVEPGTITVDTQTYNCYNIVLPEDSGKDYYYLLEPSSTANGLVLTSPYGTEVEGNESKQPPQNFDLGDINIVVPNSEFTLNYVRKNGNGFGKYIESIFNKQDQNLPININFVPGGNNQSGTFNPNNVGTININDDLTNIISDLNLGDELAEGIEQDQIELNFNSGINFNIVNEVDETTSNQETENDPNTLLLPITINNYADLSLQNVGLSNLTSFNNESTGTLTLNENCTLLTVDGGNITNDGIINFSKNGILNIGQAAKSTASLVNNNTISVLDNGTLNCYGTLTNNDNAQLTIGTDANVTMYADSTLENSGTINVAPETPAS